MNTGAVIPVLVKAELFVGEAPTTTISTWTGLNTCTAASAFVTSLATATGTMGCVCTGGSSSIIASSTSSVRSTTTSAAATSRTSA